MQYLAYYRQFSKTQKKENLIEGRFAIEESNEPKLKFKIPQECCLPLPGFESLLTPKIW